MHADNAHNRPQSGTGSPGVETDTALREVVARIVERAHPLQIILFGSAARGERGPDSDIDLLVVMPDGAHKRQTAQDLYRELRGINAPVDILVTTPADLARYKDKPGLVYGGILREGRELYAA
jgi:predicted nucleotidyltransferase